MAEVYKVIIFIRNIKSADYVFNPDLIRVTLLDFMRYTSNIKWEYMIVLRVTNIGVVETYFIEYMYFGR